MVVDEYTLIQVSLTNKAKLDDYKLAKGESYNNVLDELIEFGEENDFKSVRIENLTKKLDKKNERKIKVKQRESSKIG